MKFLDFQFTVRRLLVLIALVCINIAADIATSRYYPRLPNDCRGSGGAGKYSLHNSDGSYVIYDQPAPLPCKLTNPRLMRPPRPSLLRAWMPVIGSVAVTMVIGGVLTSRVPLPRMTTRRLAWITPIAAVAAWLVLPVIRIVGDPGGDYHVHRNVYDYSIHPYDKRVDLGAGTAVHVTPFWPRYGRLLVGRPWPDADYVCPTPPEVSAPVQPLASQSPR